MTTRQLSVVALIFIIYFAAIIIILHFLRPDVNPAGSPTSEYAVGPYGFLMSSAFVSMSIATFSLLVGLNRAIYKSAPYRAARVLFVIWGLGLFIALFFPINPDGTELTTKNLIHRINGPIIFFCVSVAVLLFAISFKRDERWRPIYAAAFTLALLMLVLFVAVGIAVANKAGVEGLLQRIFLLLLITWFILTSTFLRSRDVTRTISSERRD
jgi:hypothetical protein